MNVIVVAHDPGWVRKFEVEAEIIGAALGLAVSSIHHIGSTSIPGICAKPVIDILVEACSPEAVDQKANSLVAEGYEALGEFGLRGRRYFRKDNAGGVREFQIHVFLAGSAEAARHLAFRDYLRSHPAVAAEYSELKRDLARQFLSDIDAYMDGKNPFIKATDQMALAWWRSAHTRDGADSQKRHVLCVRKDREAFACSSSPMLGGTQGHPDIRRCPSRMPG